MADDVDNYFVEHNLLTTDEEREHCAAVADRERFEANILAQGPWGYSEKAMEAKKAAMTMLSTKTGMYARIPIICKADCCPYSETCPLLPYDLAPLGEKCPVETAQLELRAVQYADEIGYDESSFSDRQMLNDIIGYDIMLERCRALMAKEGTPVIEVVAGISESGEEIRQPAVSKAWEAYEKIVKKRNETYQLMMMTRKDNKKAGETEDNNLQSILDNVLNSDEFKDVTEQK